MLIKFILQFLIPLLTYFATPTLPSDARLFLSLFSGVIFSWLFQKIPLHITGLIGVSLTALLDIETATNAFSPLADPIIMLFLAGFLFAKAMQKTGLDKRIALNLLSLKWIKGRYNRILLIIMATTAFFSMWVSNTATAAMMLPLVLGVLSEVKSEKIDHITSLTLLGLAYSASIGGIATPIGSPPNIIAIGFLKDLANIDVSFLDWMIIALPIMLVCLSIVYFYIYLKLDVKKIRIDTTITSHHKKNLPKLSLEEKYISLLFLTLILLWFLPYNSLNAGAIGILMSSFLFMTPFQRSYKILAGKDISSIDWGSLLLFGTGLSLGKTLFNTGLAETIGNAFLASFEGSALIIFLFVLSFFTIFFTEVASNTATSNILIPIVIAFALNKNVDALTLAVCVAISSSLAFMLPVATPPNAIIYGTEKVSKNEMAKFGFVLNILMAVLLPVILWCLNS